MAKYKIQKSKKGRWYSNDWTRNKKSLDTFNTRRVNVQIINTKKNEIENLTLQMSEHLLPKASFCK